MSQILDISQNISPRFKIKVPEKDCNLWRAKVMRK
jgi:hypothetical protein